MGPIELERSFLWFERDRYLVLERSVSSKSHLIPYSMAYFLSC